MIVRKVPKWQPEVKRLSTGHLQVSPGSEPVARTTSGPRPPPPDRKQVEAYDYKDAAGNLLYQIVRFDPKGFRERLPDGSGGFTWDTADLKPVLYRLPDVIAASTVVVLEGEKDVETAYRLGLPEGWAATTSPFGTRWVSAYGEVLRDKTVVLCPDADAPGQMHLRRIGRDLVGKALELRLIVLPEKFKDLSEWAQDGTAEQFAELLKSASPVEFPP